MDHQKHCVKSFNQYLDLINSLVGMSRQINCYINKCICLIPWNFTDFRCDNLNQENILTYEILLIIGIVCLITSVLSSSLLKKISPKILFCEFEWYIFDVWLLFNFSVFFSSLGIWLTISIIACKALIFFTEFKWIIISFLLFMCFGSCANIAMAVGVNLFPERYRGMSTSIIMISGRIGSFVGSTLIGLMLDSMCTWIFYMNGAIMTSKLSSFSTNFHLIKIY